MRLLKLQPEIHKFNTFSEFAQENKFNNEDLIFTHRFLYDTFMKELDSKAQFLFIEDYGTGEPSDEMINKILSDNNSKEIRRVIAIGGGSVIDIAKLLILNETDDCIKYFEQSIPLVKEKELLIVPITCGTGSEVTNISISEIKSKKTKMGLAIDQLYPDKAILIPELLKGLPFQFFVTSSVDALIHAVEAYLSPKSNPYTEMFSVKAIEMIVSGYRQIVKNGNEYRKSIIGDFLIGSNYAGIAFGNAGVGAVHALSYPLGGNYHVPHGEANYQFFMEVLKKYECLKSEGKIKELKVLISKALEVSVEDAYNALEELLENLLPKKSLKEYGMKEEEIEKFVDGVIEKQQRLLGNNYTALSREDMCNIYRELY